MNDKAIKCSNHQEFIDRLIDNGFHFEVERMPIYNELCQSLQYRLVIPTYEYREDTWNDVGYHYYGNSITMYYYIDFGSMTDIYELIREAIEVMKTYMKNEVAKKLKDIVIHHLGVEE